MYYSHLFKNMFLVIRVPRSIFIAKTPEQYKQSGRCPGLHLTVTTPQRELLFSGQWSSRALLSMATYMPSTFFPRSRGDDRAPELVSWPLGHSQGACPSSCRSTAQAWIRTATLSSRPRPHRGLQVSPVFCLVNSTAVKALVRSLCMCISNTGRSGDVGSESSTSGNYRNRGFRLFV